MFVTHDEQLSPIFLVCHHLSSAFLIFPQPLAFPRLSLTLPDPLEQARKVLPR